MIVLARAERTASAISCFGMEKKWMLRRSRKGARKTKSRGGEQINGEQINGKQIRRR
jgi:hypothetical protein